MLFIFFGNEQSRREWCNEKGHDNKNVILAATAARSLLGRRGPVECVYSGSPDGLTVSNYLHLMDVIDVVNATAPKETA